MQLKLVLNDRLAIRSEAKVQGLSLFNEAALRKRWSQVSRGRHLGLLPLTRPNEELLVKTTTYYFLIIPFLDSASSGGMVKEELDKLIATRVSSFLKTSPKDS